jgi:hypothetical protein
MFPILTAWAQFGIGRHYPRRPRWASNDCQASARQRHVLNLTSQARVDYGADALDDLWSLYPVNFTVVRGKDGHPFSSFCILVAGFFLQ